MKFLFTNGKFIAVIWAYGACGAVYCAYGSLLDEMLYPYGYSSDDASYMGTVMTGAGIVSALLFGAYV